MPDDAATDAALEDALGNITPDDAADDDDAADGATSEDKDSDDAAGTESDTTADDTDDSDDDTTDDADDTTDGDDATGEDSSAFKDLLAKYGGDKNKMATGVWEQARSVSAISKELQDIKAMLQVQRESPEDEAAALAADPNVQEVAGELASVIAEVKSTTQEQTALIAEFGKMGNLIARLEGQHERADDLDKAEIGSKLREAKQDARQLQRDFKSAKSKLSSLETQKRQMTRTYRDAQTRAKAMRDTEKQQALDYKEQARATRSEFNEECRAAAKMHKIEVDSKVYNVINQSIKDRITSYLRSLPENAPPINIKGAVNALMSEYASAMGLKGKFHKKSKLKDATLGTTPATSRHAPKGKVPLDPSGKYWDPDFSRARARKLLG